MICRFNTETQQNQFILDYMKNHARKDQDMSILYTIAGEKVCEFC